ncbi:Clavaminate synthase-like protein [Mollisia scopiformis]|uniref:Clavaminate synthase-like protein n=1 Tax=Mollisia scopiformis TaxID=149040 RepID=A0A132B5P8_MOLSC|nr:Clavaminate synthase-like protein [Mollisia scopiformis]KUJ07573.1 Clavaminate synthase-like protein [Mollisia scopiformis]
MSQTQTSTISAERLGKIPQYIQFPETIHELDWADLATLDLSKFNTPEGKQKLAQQLQNAIQQIGFFYITNFGLTQEEVDPQFAIGKEFFNLPTEEKLKYRADLENGGYNGYKPRGLREIVPGHFDNTEIYNIPKFIPQYERPHPALIKENWPEIEKFGRFIHHEIVSKLLVLFAIILELPEKYFLERHRYDEKSDCHLRYMKYHHRTAEENEKLNNVWVKGHTDFGSLTLLFRQPVAALQVRTPQETWKYVKPYPASITVNIADSLSFLTNGYLKSSIHRVVAPPPDQAHLDRLGVLYFVRPEDDLILKPIESPLLERLGLKGEGGDGVHLTAGEWVKARVAKNVNKAGGSKEASGEQEIIKGVKAKYYD